MFRRFASLSSVAPWQTFLTFTLITLFSIIVSLLNTNDSPTIHVCYYLPMQINWSDGTSVGITNVLFFFSMVHPWFTHVLQLETLLMSGIRSVSPFQSVFSLSRLPLSTVHELSICSIIVTCYERSGILRSWLWRTWPYDSAHISEHHLMHPRACFFLLWKRHSHCQHMLLSNTWWSCPCYAVLVNSHRFGGKGTETPARELDYSWTLAW